MKRTRKTFQPAVDQYERRELLSTAALMGPVSLSAFSPSNAISSLSTPGSTISIRSTSLNQAVLQFAQSHVGQRVGGGECAQFVTEALRTTGAEFIFTANDMKGVDHGPTSNDYMWGNLIRIFDKTGASHASKYLSGSLQPGDVLQYYHTTFSSGSFSKAQHTSIVATVDSRGMPTSVYEENFNHIRSVVKNPINLAGLTAGWVRAYRPIARTNHAGPVEFTVVNNTPSTVTISLSGQTFKLDPANTVGSNPYFSGGATKLSVQGSSDAAINVANAGGYEVYSKSGGGIGIRALPSSGGSTPGLSLTSPDAPTTPKTYYTIHNSTTSATTFSLHGSGRSYTLSAGQTGSYVASNANPYVQLSNGKKYTLSDAKFDIYYASGNQLGFRFSSIAANTNYTIHNGTSSTVTYTLYGSGRSYSLGANQTASYVATNANPYIALSNGRQFKLLNGNFEVYLNSSSNLSFRWS